MNKAAELERAVLKLSAQERERLALLAWESLETDAGFTAAASDPEGLALAAARDAEIESGTVATIDHAEFLRRTGKTADES